MLFDLSSKLVFIGDSITDCGRSRPIGEGSGDALGFGFVRQVDTLIQSAYPEGRVRTINMGIGGHTVRHLDARWQTDVFDLEPDVLVIMIGINDVWRHFDSFLQPEQAVGLEEYSSTLENLVTMTQPEVDNMVLMTPFMIEPNREEPMRKMMDEYGAAMKKIGASAGVPVVDIQAAYDKFCVVRHPMSIAIDRVHPNQVGHMVITRAFLNAVGFDWSRLG